MLRFLVAVGLCAACFIAAAQQAIVIGPERLVNDPNDPNSQDPNGLGFREVTVAASLW